MAPPVPTAAPAPNPRLTAEDLQILIAVKGKALRQLEEALAASENEGGDVLSRVKDLAASEREAALALGVSWKRYSWVKEEIARALSEQRQREDAQLLTLELRRSKEDLEAQLERSTDEAAREFLQAQISTLDQQLGAMERERTLAPVATEQLRLLETVRAELAELQGQQDRLQRRIRELVRSSRSDAGVSGGHAPH